MGDTLAKRRPFFATLVALFIAPGADRAPSVVNGGAVFHLPVNHLFPAEALRS